LSGPADQVWDYLASNGPSHYVNIANAIGKTDKNTAGILSKNKDLFEPLGDGVWKIK